eukprot:4604682-Amphidinium_carterae.2
MSPALFLCKARTCIAPMHRSSSSRNVPSICRLTSWRRCPEVTGKAAKAPKASVVQPAASAAVPFLSLRVAISHCFCDETASAISVAGSGVIEGNAVVGAGAHLCCTASAVSFVFGAMP